MVAHQTNPPVEERAGFVGRVQEQRQFLVALQGLLAHHQRWAELAAAPEPPFDPARAPGDDSYANIFLPHGIGGIGKSWLTRRCLALAQGIPHEPPILTLYNDVSLGAPVLQPEHLLERLAGQLAEAGYGDLLAPYWQARDQTPAVIEKVTRYQFDRRDRWESLLQLAADLLARSGPEPAPAAFPQLSLAHTHIAAAETAGHDAPTLVKACDLLLDEMQQANRLSPAEAALFRNPPAAQAARLATALQHAAARQPLVIGLDNLEIIVPLEPLIRDSLVLPTNQSPIIWILSGRYNLADERVVELPGGSQVFKGYRDLLGENPPVVWDMSLFGDADLRDFLEAESDRRRAPLLIDNALIQAIKTTSSGVPLVVEMVTDALFAMDRDEFLREFALDDRTLLPGDRLNKITGRFLRTCLTHPGHLEQVQALALLRTPADDDALAALWRLPSAEDVPPARYNLRMRYAFVLPDGLHDAVYDFVRRQIRTDPQAAAVRERLSRRAIDHYRPRWEARHAAFDDPALRVRDPQWQNATRDLLNAHLWNNPDQAVLFLLPRFVEGLGFDRAFAGGLLRQAEEFLTDSISTFSDSYAALLHRLRLGLQNLDWTFDEPGEALGPMLDSLLDAPGLADVHRAILHLWQGNWHAEQGRLDAALEAYRRSDALLTPTDVGLHRQLGRAYFEISSRLLWPDPAAGPAPTEPALQAARRATELAPDNAGAWFNLAVALDGLGRPAEAAKAAEQAVKLEPRALYLNRLGDIYRALDRTADAEEVYRQATEQEPAFAWPYHNLGVIHAARGEHEAALKFLRQAIEHHHHDRDRAVSWNEFGDIHAALGNAEEAISAYRWAGVLDPAFAAPWFGLGNVYAAQERHREAADAYQKAIALAPEHAWAHHRLGQVYARQGDADAAIPAFEQALKFHAADAGRAETWAALGDAYRAQNRPHDAIEAYRRAVKFNPQQAAPWHNLADVYAGLGNTDAAVSAYRQAVELDPDFAAPWERLAEIFAAREQDDDAIAAYRWVIELEPDSARAYHRLADIYSRRGEHAPAAEFYRKAIERQPDDAAAALSWSNLAGVQAAQGNPDAAIKSWRRAIGLNPDFAPSYHNLARLLEQRGEDDQAIGLYRQAIERYTTPAERADAWFELALVYQRQSRHRDAVESYRQVIALEPSDAEAWNNLADSYRLLGQNTEAREAYRQAIALDDGYALPYHSLGEMAADSGDAEAAAGYFRQAIERHEDDESRAISWNLLGDAQQSLGVTEEAARAYRQAARLAPGFARPRHSLGQISESRGEFEAALDFYRQAAERYPADAFPVEQSRLWAGLGNVYRALNRPADAADAYRQSIKFADDFAPAWAGLADVSVELGQPDEAVPAYERAIELDPAPPQPYHNLGLILEERGQFDAAASRFRRALERSEGVRAAPDIAATWYHLGNAYRGLAQTGAAIDACRRAVELHPDYFEPWAALADLYRQTGQDDAAEEACLRAVDLNPTAAAPWRHLGDIYLSRRRYDEAANAYRQAATLAPDAPEPLHNLGIIAETLGRHDEAAAYYEQAISRYAPEQRAELARAWNGLGNSRQAREQTGPAADAYRTAIELAPDFAPPYHSLGRIHAAAGRHESAILRLRQALDRYPAGEAFDEARAVAWDDLGDSHTALRQWDSAADAYRQAIVLDDEFALPWFSLGNVQRAKHRPDEAADAYRKAIELDPDHAWARNNLALVLADRGEIDAAIELYRQAIERHAGPLEKAVTWNNLGDALQPHGRLDEAAGAYRQAIDLNPRFARPWKSLGDVYRAQQKTTGIVEAYQQAINLEPDYPWPYHSLGLIYKNAGAYAQAEAYYRQAIERQRTDRDRAVSWNGLGNVYLAMGQLNRAIEAYQTAVRLNPADAWPYHNLGFVYKQLGQHRQAMGMYLQAIDRFDSDAPKSVTWNNLGNVYTALGRDADALAAYRTAIELNDAYALPWNSLGEIHLRQTRPADAAQAFEEAIRRYPQYALAWNNLGDARWKLGNIEETIRAYEQAIQLDERYAWPYHNLGLVYDERGDYESALSYYEQAIARHTDPAQKAVLAEKMGDLYRISGETGRALEAYHRAAAFDPAYASPWYSLGNVYATLAQDDEAISAYRRAIELQPADPWPYHNLALVYEKRESFGEAVTLYRQAIERHRTDRERAVSWDSLGSLYSDLGRLDEAAHAFEQSIRLNAEFALPWNSLGDVYLKLGDTEKAVDAYRKAIDLDPDYVWAYNNLGAAYESMGQTEQAVQIYRQIIDRQGDNPELAVTWSNLGDIYDSQQREQEAIDAYETAIHFDPDDTWAYNRLGALYERRGDRDQAYALYRQATRRHRRRKAK